MNSTAAIKAFTGRHGGAVCTSSNAERSLQWAFEQGEKVLFLPDQHLGRNTAVLKTSACPRRLRRLQPEPARRGADGRPAQGRPDHPVEGPLLGARPVHPGLRRRGARAGARGERHRASGVPVRGRREGRRRRLDRVHHQDHQRGSEPGSAWAVGTELNLVKRLAMTNPDKEIVFLDRTSAIARR
jgi:quinolinate synthase